MMLKEIREQVYEANMDLPQYGLVVFTWGNASQVDQEKGLFVIKPSGVSYEDLSPENMVVCDLEGRAVEGDLNPSSDTPTHAFLYRTWDDIGGIVHTHSNQAVSWAQAGRSIPCYGTTQADYFYGEVPCMKSKKTMSLIPGKSSLKALRASIVPAVSTIVLIRDVWYETMDLSHGERMFTRLYIMLW